MRTRYLDKDLKGTVVNLAFPSLHGGLLELTFSEMKQKITFFRQNCDLASGVSTVYMMKCCAADKIFNVNSGKIEIQIILIFCLNSDFLLYIFIKLLSKIVIINKII